jgi:regulator of sigma E protease
VPDFLVSFAKLILLGLPTLGLIVFVHELGHFVAARIVGVRVITFSLGFGKRVWGIEHGGTDYRVCILPLGGYVKMAGDQIEEDRDGAADEFLSRRWYERAFIAAAGPGANFVMAAVCGVLYFATGIQYPLQPNVVGPVLPGSAAAAVGLVEGERVDAIDGELVTHWREVRVALDDAADEERGVTFRLSGDERGEREVRVPANLVQSLGDSLVAELPAEVGQLNVGTPAYQAGLRVGDVIVAVEGVAIRSWYDLLREIQSRPGQEITLEVERDGSRFTRSLSTIDNDGVGMIGVGVMEFGTAVQHYGLAEAVPLGISLTLDVWRQVVTSIGSAFSMIFRNPREASSGLAGPLAIMQISAQQAEAGRSELIFWLMFLSLALLSMNLLPIPVLDGGHIVVALYEGVSRRPISPPIYVAMYRMGLLFLLALMTLAFASDGFKFVQRNQAVRAVDEVTTPAAAPVDDDAAPSEGS